jgi:hypothetical protein
LTAYDNWEKKPAASSRMRRKDASSSRKKTK